MTITMERAEAQARMREWKSLIRSDWMRYCMKHTTPGSYFLDEAKNEKEMDLVIQEFGEEPYARVELRIDATGWSFALEVLNQKSIGEIFFHRNPFFNALDWHPIRR